MLWQPLAYNERGQMTRFKYGNGVETTTITSTKYWHKDHLGSNVAITNAAGAVIERMAYDPFGKRRTTGGAYDQNGTLRGANTDRGFTGHEHLDDLGFIHMNGRIFDPSLGRFLSADPYIQYADNIQSYNRYSYLMNNPLNATDPTGYFKLKKALKIAAVIALSVMTYGAVSSMIMSAYSVTAGAAFAEGISLAAMAAATPIAAGSMISVGMVAAVGAGAAAGFMSSFASSGGDFKAGLNGALSGAFFGMAGGATGDMSGMAGYAAKVGSHAVAGCASSMVAGGDCGEGAMSAAVAKGITVALEAHYLDQGKKEIPFAVGFTAAVVSGGITAQMGGGKFANGAVTAAYGYLFNQCSQGKCSVVERVKEYFSNASASAGAGAAFHAFVGGLSYSESVSFDTNKQACSIQQVCLRLGPGALASAGGQASATVESGSELQHAGDSTLSVGFGGDIATGPTGGSAQVLVDQNRAVSGSTGALYGVGYGFSFRLDFCYARVRACTKEGGGE